MKKRPFWPILIETRHGRNLDDLVFMPSVIYYTSSIFTSVFASLLFLLPPLTPTAFKRSASGISMSPSNSVHLLQLSSCLSIFYRTIFLVHGCPEALDLVGFLSVAPSLHGAATLFPDHAPWRKKAFCALVLCHQYFITHNRSLPHHSPLILCTMTARMTTAFLQLCHDAVTVRTFIPIFSAQTIAQQLFTMTEPLRTLALTYISKYTH